MNDKSERACRYRPYRSALPPSAPAAPARFRRGSRGQTQSALKGALFGGGSSSTLSAQEVFKNSFTGTAFFFFPGEDGGAKEGGIVSSERMKEDHP